MRRRPLSGWMFVFLLIAGRALAQENAPDAWIDVQGGLTESHATGFIPSDPALYEQIPLTQLHRDFLPVSVDLSARFPSPGSQGRMGSCVAWAVGYAARSYYAHVTEKRSRNSARHIPSPAYIYHSVRPGGCDGGSHITSALELLKTGSPSLAQAPYSDRSCHRPTAKMKNAATDFRIEGWRRVDYGNPDQIKAQLAAGNPVIFGMKTTPQSFHSARRGPVYEWNGEAGAAQSGHAITIVGYDDRKQAFRIVNSWGRNWGDRGFLWIGYDSAARLGDEAYVMKMQTVNPPIPEPAPERPEPELVASLGLSKIRCSKLSARLEDGQHVIAGFVGYAGDLSKLRAAAAGKPIRLDVDLRPWPQCEVLLTMSKPLASPGGPSITLGGDKAEFAAGENLALTIKAPDYPSYLYLAYIQADGSVVNIQQPQGRTPTPSPAYGRLVLGDGSDGKAKYTVTAPFGREMIIAVAAKSPLFDQPLPERQTEREYLTAMRQALLVLPESGAVPRVVTGAVAAFTTREKMP